MRFGETRWPDWTGRRCGRWARWRMAEARQAGRPGSRRRKGTTALSSRGLFVASGLRLPNTRASSRPEITEEQRPCHGRQRQRT